MKNLHGCLDKRDTLAAAVADRQRRLRMMIPVDAVAPAELHARRFTVKTRNLQPDSKFIAFRKLPLEQFGIRSFQHGVRLHQPRCGETVFSDQLHLFHDRLQMVDLRHAVIFQPDEIDDRTDFFLHDDLFPMHRTLRSCGSY